MIGADEAPRIDVERGIDVIAISAETRDGSEQLQADWKLERLHIAYGLTEPSMREWGLFVSRGGATTNRRPLQATDRITVDGC